MDYYYETPESLLMFPCIRFWTKLTTGIICSRMQSNVERIVTKAYSELEASVVRFLKSVDELTASSIATDEQGRAACDGDGDGNGNTCTSTSGSVVPQQAITEDNGDLDLSILAIRSLAASQSRELWTTTTGVVERVLEVVRTSLPVIIDDVERSNDARCRKQKERYRRSLEAARVSCRKDWQGRLTRSDREWQTKTDRAKADHSDALLDVEMRAESAETSRRVLSSRLDVAEETIQKLEYGLAKTTSELEQTKHDKDEITSTLNGEVAEAERREQRAQEGLVDCEKRLRHAEARYEAKVQKLTTVKDELREIRQELRTRTKDLASLRTRYREKEDECRHAQKRTNDLEASLQFVGRPSPSKGGLAAHTT